MTDQNGQGWVAIIALIAIAVWIFIFLPLIYLPEQAKLPSEIAGVKLGELLLVLATLALWWATRDLVHSAEKTAERQLRAYLIVTADVLLPREGQPRPGLNIGLTVENTGCTPASKVRVVSNTDIYSYPLPGDFNYHSFEAQPDAAYSTIGANRRTVQNIDLPLTQLKLDQLNRTDGNFRLCTYGRVDYTDIFDRDRYTHFCMWWEWENGEPIGTYSLSSEHNDFS